MAARLAALRGGGRVKRYRQLLTIFYKNTLMNEMEYRVNFWSNLATSVFWLVWAALSVRVYFFHAETIAGWTYHELLIVLGLFFTLNGFRQMVLEPNLSRLSEYVRMGTLDYILTKPVNSQFLISLRNVGVLNWSDPLLGVGLVIYALSQLGYTPGLAQVAAFAILLVVGMVLLYSLSLILQTLTIWLVNMQDISMIVESALEIGRFPVQFYRGWLSIVLTTFVPIAFMTTFPAQALMGRLDANILWIAVLFAGVLFAAASGFWRFALRFYTGASS
jgi:ABC-2 type transport system permease protein